MVSATPGCEAHNHLTDLCIVCGISASRRSDTGPALVAEAVQQGVVAVGAQTAVFEPASLWDRGDSESFNARRGDVHLDD